MKTDKIETEKAVVEACTRYIAQACSLLFHASGWTSDGSHFVAKDNIVYWAGGGVTDMNDSLLAAGLKTDMEELSNVAF